MVTAGIASAASAPSFDVHLHYNQAHVEAFAPARIVEILESNQVERALVTSTPAHHAAALYRIDPERIVPFLGVYGDDLDKSNWFLDPTLPARVSEDIGQGPWRGIGELHLFAAHRHSPVLRRLVELAARKDLVLLMHADPAVVDTIYEITPEATMLWAHAGTFPYPELLRDYLKRYPRLYVDLSVREAQIAPEGMLADEWFELFLEYPDRFMIGVDTYSTKRWRHYGGHLADIHDWLEQLPAPVSRRIRYDNAASMFSARPSARKPPAAQSPGTRP